MKLKRLLKGTSFYSRMWHSYCCIIYYMKRYFRFVLLIGLLGLVETSPAQWTNRRPMRFARYGAMTAVVNNKIYVIGGLVNSNSAVSYVEEYNPALDSWITRAPMPTARGMAVCGVIDNKIYVIGGVRARNLPVETVEVYNPATNQWQAKKRLPSRRTGYNGGVIGDSIYVCGGYFQQMSSYTDTVEVYCASRDSWFTRQSMQQARVDFGAAVFHDRLFAVSGLFFNYLNQTEEYSPVCDTWQMRSVIPIARAGIGCAASHNRIFAIGGERRQPRIAYNRVDIYNTENNTWGLLDTINLARSYAGVVSLGNHIYVIGGLMRNESPTHSVEAYLLSGCEEEKELLTNKSLPLKIFPNPASSYFVVRCPLPADLSSLLTFPFSLKLFDVSGKEVKSEEIRATDNRISLNGIKNGVYFVSISDNRTTSIIKIVKLKE